MKYDTKVMPSNKALEGRTDLRHYEGQVGHVSAPSPEGGTHVMVFWSRMGVSSVWAINDLVEVK